MQDHLIWKSKISAHHGCIDCENELEPTIELLNRCPEINMVEIDFVYVNEKFISSHDYETESISRGSEMSVWFDRVLVLGKMIWIDIKESNWSILSDKFGKFDIDKFYLELEAQRAKLLRQDIQLERYVIISCQYDSVKDRLFAVNNHRYLLAHDLPFIGSYVAQVVAPSFLDQQLNSIVRESMENFINYLVCDQPFVVCLDMTFFNSSTDIMDFINKTKASIIIIYSMELSNPLFIDNCDKHVLYQYNYYNLLTENKC